MAGKENREAWGWLQTWLAAGTDAQPPTSTRCSGTGGEVSGGPAESGAHTHTHTHPASCCRTQADGHRQCSSEVRFPRASANEHPAPSECRKQSQDRSLWGSRGRESLTPNLERQPAPQAQLHCAVQAREGAGCWSQVFWFTTEFLAPSSGLGVFEVLKS